MTSEPQSPAPRIHGDPARKVPVSPRDPAQHQTQQASGRPTFMRLSSTADGYCHSSDDRREDFNMKPAPRRHHHGLVATPLLLLSRPDMESRGPQRSGPRSVLSGGRRVSRPLPSAEHFGSDTRQCPPVPVRRTTMEKSQSAFTE